MILTCPPSKRRERDVRGGPRGRGSRRRPSTPRAGTRRSRRGAAPSKRWSSAPGTRSAIRCAFTIGANWWSVPFSSRVGAEIFGSSSYASSRALARRCRRAPNAEMPGSRGSRTVRDGRPAIPACTWGRPLPRTPPRGRRRARRRRTTSMLRSTAWGPPGVVQPRTRRRTRSGWSTASHCATRQPSTCHRRPRSVGRGGSTTSTTSAARLRVVKSAGPSALKPVPRQSMLTVRYAARSGHTTSHQWWLLACPVSTSRGCPSPSTW